MDGKMLSYSIDNCFICSELMGSFKNELTVVTGYSEKPIYELIEAFTETSFSPEVLEEAGVCQNCFIRFNEYDEHQALADQIKLDLVTLFEASNNEMEQEIKIEAVDSEYIMHLPAVYTSIEEDDKESMREMFAPVTPDPEINDGGEIIVEYDWLEESNVKPLVSQTMDQKKVESKEKIKVIDKGNSLKGYQCDVCFKSFKEKSKLKTHREIHTTERNVVCPICQKAFKTQACLRSHKRVHNPTYMFCDICGKPYTQKPELSKHIKFVHFNIRDFFCSTCGAGFGSKGHLSAHMLTHQDNSVKTNVCQICSLAFHTRAKLDRHMKSHTGERNYECSLCGKRFLYSYNVTAHVRHVHYREKRKENEKTCSFCGKKFQKVWKFKEHLAEEHQVVIEAIIETEYE